MKSLLAAVSMEKVRLLSCIVHNATRSVCSCINNVEIVILSTINEPIDILALEAALPPARIITSPPKLLLMKNAPQDLHSISAPKLSTNREPLVPDIDVAKLVRVAEVAQKRS